MRFAASILVAAAAAACVDGGAVPTENERSTAVRLAQVWDVSLDNSPDSRSKTAVRTSGQVAFVLNSTYMKGSPRDPSNYGSYAIDFLPLGFELENAPIPIATAWSLPGDSVEIILGPSDAPNVVIRAGLVENTLRGRWYLRLPRGAGGSGTVTATPHDRTQR